MAVRNTQVLFTVAVLHMRASHAFAAAAENARHPVYVHLLRSKLFARSCARQCAVHAAHSSHSNP
eukprot:3160-Heterococcus_DN1.PRE.7